MRHLLRDYLQTVIGVEVVLYPLTLLVGHFGYFALVGDVFSPAAIRSPVPDEYVRSVGRQLRPRSKLADVQRAQESVHRPPRTVIVDCWDRALVDELVFEEVVYIELPVLELPRLVQHLQRLLLVVKMS